MKTLIKTPSVSGTNQEMTAAYKLIELLYEIPYFNNNRENVQLVPLVDDPFNRSIVTAYLEIKPDCLDAVILTGHFDVVDVEEYGHLKDIAYDVEAVTKRINEMPLDEDSKKDFESGEWLFGRGTADMKFGHALCLELLKHYSQEGGINGNILYVAVCGEETNSEGMLRAVSYFNELKEKKGLNYKALLLTECYMMEDQINDTNRYIHFGASVTSGNYFVYGCSRYLWSLSKFNQAPKFCSKTNKNGVPIYALGISMAFALLGVVSQFIAEDTVYLFLIYLIGGLTIKLHKGSSEDILKIHIRHELKGHRYQVLNLLVII